MAIVLEIYDLYVGDIKMSKKLIRSRSSGGSRTSGTSRGTGGLGVFRGLRSPQGPRIPVCSHMYDIAVSPSSSRV